MKFKMIAKAQRKISAAGAAEITDDVIKIADKNIGTNYKKLLNL